MSRAESRRLRQQADLTVPRGVLPSRSGRHDPDTFGRFSEAIARFLGTGRFIAVQTILVIIWVVLNSLGLIHRWDPYPFILLNLVFSTQSAYAAPLILLAQNRQDDRDRATIERDRDVAARTQADIGYLIRELAAIRLVLADALTTEDLQDSIAKLEDLAAARPGHPD